MKPEEVLKILYSPLDKYQGSMAEATVTIIQALEKQVAKKGFKGWGYGCSVCGYQDEYTYDYCPLCGQKLDWSEE